MIILKSKKIKPQQCLTRNLVKENKVKLNSKGGIQNVANKLKASKAHAAQAATLEKLQKK